ncbi:MAG: response regulator transcription factor [Alphaproteobacteria bacterium]|nr:response regulator transcription factor [Alphaproteobacteria bacterium]
MKILLVEDDVKLGRVTQELLTYENCSVDWAQDGAEAEDLIKSSLDSSYDIVILDWMLPGINGIEICRFLRNKYNFQGGIVFITAKGELDDCVCALNSGADDFIVKPFKIKELIARLNAVCRRKEKPFVDRVYAKSGVEIDRNLNIVRGNGTELRLRKKEFELFEILFINSGRILPRRTVFEKIWSDKPDTNMESLDSHIYMLRKSLKELPQIRIKSVKNIGYKMEINE